MRGGEDTNEKGWSNKYLCFVLCVESLVDQESCYKSLIHVTMNHDVSNVSDRETRFSFKMWIGHTKLSQFCFYHA